MMDVTLEYTPPHPDRVMPTERYKFSGEDSHSVIGNAVLLAARWLEEHRGTAFVVFGGHRIKIWRVEP